MRYILQSYHRNLANPDVVVCNVTVLDDDNSVLGGRDVFVNILALQQNATAKGRTCWGELDVADRVSAKTNKPIEIASVGA